MNSYEEKQERKRARLERASENAKQESDRRLNAARTSVDGIPSGQPILIDHHSAKRHRGALKKHDTHMRKAVEADKRATELAHRAAAVGTGGISSDDPDALAKLDDKVAALIRQRDNMKAINALYKQRDEATLVERFGFTLEQLDAMAARSWDKRPYPSFTLTNLGARIRQAQKRATLIERVDAMPATSDETVGAGTISTDPDDNRVLVRFAERLSKDDYKRMRSAGFVWSPTRTAFVRKLTGPSVVLMARRAVEQLDVSKALAGGAQ